jgi:hypothetical protein
MPYNADLFRDFASTSITGGAGGIGTTMAATDTTFTVATGTGALFPSPTNGQSARLLVGQIGGVHEVMQLTGRSGDALTVVRGNNLGAPDTNLAQVWIVGSAVGLINSAGSMTNIWNILAPQPGTAEYYGAVGDGSTDDTTAIQAALNAAPAGGVVLLGPKTYRTSAPLTIPPQVTLMGPHIPHLDTNAACIKPLVSFSGAAAILLLDEATGSYAIASTEQSVIRMTIDCSALSGSTIDGIQMQGYCHGHIFQDIEIKNPPNHGVAWVANGSGNPYSGRFTRVVVSSSGGYGFSFSTTDTTFIDCESIGSGKSAWFIGGAQNCHFTNCRAEWASSGYNGFDLTGSWSSGTGSGGCTFTGCSTDRNDQYGFHITATGTVPVIFTGCMARRDGRNGGSGGAYAGFACIGSTIPVIINGLTVFPGVDDNGTGTSSPKYGFHIGSSAANVTLNAGYIQAATTGVHDDGSNSNWYRSPNVLEATGSTSSPTYTTGYAWSTNGTGKIAFATNDQQALTISNTGTNTNTPLIQVVGAANSTRMLDGEVSGDTSNRYDLRVDGQMQWGSGSTSRDTNLYRSTANTLKTDNNLAVGTNLTVTGTSSLDAGTITTDGSGHLIAVTYMDTGSTNGLQIHDNSTNMQFKPSGNNYGMLFTGRDNGGTLHNGITIAASGAVTSNGALTASLGITVSASGLTVTAGGLTVTAGVTSLDGAAITTNGSGAITAVGAITSTGAITTSGNISTSGTGTITAANGLTATAGGVTATAGGLTVTAGVSSLDGAKILTDGAGSIDVQGHALGIAQPREHGLVAWAFDPSNVASGKAGVAQTLYVIQLYVNRSANITKLYWGVNTGGSGPTTAHNAIGLFNASGTLLQSAAIVDGHVTGTGLFTETITTQAVTPGKYYVGILIDASSMPQIYRGQDLNATLLNAGITTPSANVRYGTGGTGITAIATFTAASVAAAQFSYWAAIG